MPPTTTLAQNTAMPRPRGARRLWVLSLPPRHSRRCLSASDMSCQTGQDSRACTSDEIGPNPPTPFFRETNKGAVPQIPTGPQPPTRFLDFSGFPQANSRNLPPHLASVTGTKSSKGALGASTLVWWRVCFSPPTGFFRDNKEVASTSNIRSNLALTSSCGRASGRSISSSSDPLCSAMLVGGRVGVHVVLCLIILGKSKDIICYQTFTQNNQP